jgi:hypothetical protein
MNTNHISIERLLQRNGVKPQADGRYRLFDVDKAFRDAGMTAESRMFAKATLNKADLLD